MAAIDYYPVGSIYMSLEDTSPASFIGGNWDQLTETFLLGSGATYSVGDPDLGETTHTLQTSEIPSHRHALNKSQRNSTGGSTYAYAYSSNRSRWQPSVVASGGGGAHENMPPYVVINMWKRVS